MKKLDVSRELTCFQTIPKLHPHRSFSNSPGFKKKKKKRSNTVKPLNLEPRSRNLQKTGKTENLRNTIFSNDDRIYDMTNGPVT